MLGAGQPPQVLRSPQLKDKTEFSIIHYAGRYQANVLWASSQGTQADAHAEQLWEWQDPEASASVSQTLAKPYT